MRHTRRIWMVMLLMTISAISGLGQTVLSVGGDVTSPLSLKAEDLAQMPRQTVWVTDHGGAKVSYGGVWLVDVLKKAGAPFGKELRGKALASYLMAKGSDGYAVAFTLADLDADMGNAPVLVADQKEGKALLEHEGPLRLIWPNDKVGARSIRMVVSVDLVKVGK